MMFLYDVHPIQERKVILTMFISLFCKRTLYAMEAVQTDLAPLPGHEPRFN